VTIGTVSLPIQVLIVELLGQKLSPVVLAGSEAIRRCRSCPFSNIQSKARWVSGILRLISVLSLRTTQLQLTILHGLVLNGILTWIKNWLYLLRDGSIAGPLRFSALITAPILLSASACIVFAKVIMRTTPPGCFHVNSRRKLISQSRHAAIVPVCVE
jgi:hypothetical protein